MTHKVIPPILLVTPEKNYVLDQNHSDVVTLFLGKAYDTFYHDYFLSWMKWLRKQIVSVYPMQAAGNEGISSYVLILLLFVDADTSPLDFTKVGLTPIQQFLISCFLFQCILPICSSLWLVFLDSLSRKLVHVFLSVCLSQCSSSPLYKTCLWARGIFGRASTFNNLSEAWTKW